MHARDGASQDDGTSSSLPPGVGPRCSKHKKQRERNGAGRNSNEGRPNHVGRAVAAVIVADGGVAEVVHAANGSP